MAYPLSLTLLRCNVEAIGSQKISKPQLRLRVKSPPLR